MIPVKALQTLQRRYGSADWTRWEAQRWQFYDYVRYPLAGTTQLRFFSVALGGQDPNSLLAKTLEQTNLSKGASFGQVYFIIKQIRTHAFFLPKNRQNATIAADADVIYTLMTDAMSKFVELMRDGVLNIEILAKKYFDIERPLVTAPPGFGLTIYQHGSSFLAASPQAGIWAVQNPNGSSVYDANPPQVVEPEQSFQVTLDYPNGLSPVFTDLVGGGGPVIDIGVIFDGYIVRPAQ
jgi:hypothetical protein